MANFLIHPQISMFEDFAAFAKEFNLGENDLIVTNEYIYEPFIKKSGVKCPLIFQEKYGMGEPSDQMIDAIKKTLPSITTIESSRLAAVP